MKIVDRKKTLQIDEQDAQVIVQMAEICDDQGMGPEGGSLLTRIANRFGVEIIPQYMRRYLIDTDSPAANDDQDQDALRTALRSARSMLNTVAECASHACVDCREHAAKHRDDIDATLQECDVQSPRPAMTIEEARKTHAEAQPTHAYYCRSEGLTEIDGRYTADELEALAVLMRAGEL